MTLDNSGQVGIGTTSPVVDLHVNSHDSTTGNEYTHFALESTPDSGKNGSTEIDFLGRGDGDGHYIDYSTNNARKLIFRSMSVDANLLQSDHAVVMTLDNSGQVGIGTVSPSQMLHVNGNFVASGTKSAIVDTAHYGQRKLYAFEQASNRFADEGKAKLVNGVARVELDPIFLETIERDFFIHLTPYGNVSLYVAEVGRDYFVVNAQERSDEVEFVWMLTATRKGYDEVRLEQVEETKQEFATRQMGP